MPKADDTTFFEKHIEKVVLGACVVLLALAAFRWVLSSPVTLELIPEDGRGQPVAVPPEEADQHLLEAARSVGRIHDRSTESVAPMPKYADRISSLRPIAAASGEPVDLGVAFEPILTETRRILGPEQKVKLADLVQLLPAPPRPQVVANIEVPETDAPDDKLVARGVTTYPLGKVRIAWLDELQNNDVTGLTVRTIVKQVLIEAQKQLPDGQWGPAKVVQGAARPDDQGQSRVPGPIPAFDGANHQAVRDARDALGRGEMQAHIIQPAYYRLWDVRVGWSDWKKNLPEVVAADPNTTPVWFHDDSTVEVGQTYRYRVKLVFVNPLLTYATEIGGTEQAQKDARTPEISTPFSEWSEPVAVSRRLRFFLTGNNPMAREMILTLFAHKWGQMVSRTFRVKPGMVIGGPAQVPVRPIGGEANERKSVEVDFSTGAIVLQCDFNYKLVERGMTLTTSKLIYLDASGKLKARIQVRDKRDPRFEQLRQAVKQAQGG